MQDGRGISFGHRSTVVGPELERMPEARRVAFRASLVGLLQKLNRDGRTMGRTASNVLRAIKPRSG